MHRKSTILLSVFLLLSLLITPAGSAAAQAPERSARDSAASIDVLPAVAPNLIQDPSLQASYRVTTFWQQASSNADWTVCTTSNVDCLISGVAGPRTGTRWGMFGIPDWEDPETINPEVATLSQTVTFPGCGASLSFYLWIGQAAAGSNANDVFNVKIDNTTVFSANATQISSYAAYTLVTVDVSAFANGAAHTIEFHSVTTDQAVIFNLDDISLTRTCVTISGNAGIAGATVDYTGGTTTANGSGAYSFDVDFDWSGTVTPSKTGYSFSPPSRNYANLATDQPGQNYAATLITYTISGNVGVPTTTLSFTDGTPKTTKSDASGNYSLSVTYNWSGTVTPSHPCFTFDPTDRSYTNVLANQTAQDYTPTPIPASGCTDIDVEIGGVNRGTYSIASQGSMIQAPFPTVNSGPVKLASTVPILGSERIILKAGGVNTSFTEMIGLPDGQLDNTYWLPWYNNKDMDTQLRIANVSGADATITITIGGVPKGSFPLVAGASTRLSYAGLNAGPVKIESTQNIVAAERVILKVNGIAASFTEMMALPASQLDNTYWLPWYNNKDMDTQLRIANVSGTNTTITITIGGVPKGSFDLAAGASTRLSYAGLNAGPVKIESTENIIAAERVILKANNIATSFSETMGLPDGQLDSTYWLLRYNNKSLDTQFRLANVSDSQDANVHIYIDDQELTGSPFLLPAGASIRKSFANTDGGLVRIESDIPIVAAQRVILKVNGVNTSYSELMGLPNTQLDDIYWLPWYNNVDLDTVLRFGVP